MKLLPNVPLEIHARRKRSGTRKCHRDGGELARNGFRELQSRLVLVVVPTTGVQLKVDGKTIGPVPESAKVNPGQHQLGSRPTATPHL